MKALAAFAMKRSFNVYLLAAISAAMPFTFWLSAALVGLVTLRKGHTEGIGALLAALAGSTLGMVYLGNAVAYLPLYLSSTAIVLLASVLRSTQAWNLTLIAGTGIAITYSMIAATFLGSIFDPVTDQLLAQLSTIPDANVYRQLVEDMAMNNGFILIFAGGSVDLAVLILMLARSWQSSLYNPGGFRQEMHQLRLAPWMVIVLVVLAFIVSKLNMYALEPVILPLLITGITLVQSVMAKRDMGGPWIAALYIGMLLVPYMLPLVVILGMIDAFVDLRARVPASKNTQGNNDNEV